MIQSTLLLVTLLFGGTDPAVNVYTLNTTESVIEWKGEKIVGNSHTGTLKFSEGAVKVKKGNLVGGKFLVDMTSLKESNGSSRLEGHLKSDDFFSVEKFPTAELVIKSSKKGENGVLEVTADLTIKGNTEEITFLALMKEEGDGMMVSVELTFDRSKYDVRYGSNSFFDNLADKAISDDIKLSIRINASK